jgi:hypothetical protein
MTPSIEPNVSSIHNEDPYHGVQPQPPPREEVVRAIEDEAEVNELFSIKRGAVIGE